MKAFPTSRRQQGITLIEITIGLAIGMSIAVTAMSLAVATRRDMTQQELQAQVMLVASQTQNLGQTSGSYAGVTAELLVDTGRIPREWVRGTDGSWLIGHVHSGTIQVAPISIQGGTNNAAQLIVDNLPIDACIGLLMNLQGSFLTIGRQAAADLKPIAGTPLTNEQITTACNAGATPGKNLLLGIR